MKEKLYDVVIMEIKTRIVDAVVGTNLRSTEDGHRGFYSVEKRVETVLPRINEHYMVKVVKAGKFQKGDRLP